MTPPLPYGVRPEPTGPDEESVWRYPRPPALEPEPRRIRIVHRGVVLADTTAAFRVLETSHPPSYYLPPDAVASEYLEPAGGGSICEWKGAAKYWTVDLRNAEGDGERLERVGWSYPDPTRRFAGLRDHLAFYAAAFDEVTVGGEQVEPQPGGFYGGWVTSWVKGPFKGGPGSWGW
jgi:uncharacterized protein (DUF427 family)